MGAPKQDRRGGGWRASRDTTLPNVCRYVTGTRWRSRDGQRIRERLGMTADEPKLTPRVLERKKGS